MRLQLSIGMAVNPRTRPIFDGTVAADAIDLLPSAVHPSELFWRQLRFGDFDVSEMSLSSLMIAVANGDDRWIGLPVFTTRHFFQTWALVRADAGIERPADLKGKRVGVPEYQQTAAMWTRGVLEHEFGVKPSDMEFWMERPASHSHAGAAGFTPPPGVVIRQIPPEKDIGGMMISGELDATLLYLTDKNLVDRSRIDLTNHPRVRPLFPDPIAEGTRFYRKTGIYPINHTMVIKRAIMDKHPWVALNLFKAFQKANALADERRREHVAYHLAAGLIPPEAGPALSAPVLQHGVGANRATLETAALYSQEQGLTPRRIELSELFAASTLLQ